jgi:unsaturated rhamnogalacturonyl hydrolase
MNQLKKAYVFFTAIVLLYAPALKAQNKLPYSQQMAKTVMTIWKDTLFTGDRWTYDQGVILKGIEGIWQQTGDKKYFDYIQKCMDRYVTADGTIRTYHQTDYNIDNVLCGRNVITLYKVLGNEKYYKAATLLREQLRKHPRVPEGGFWHKKVYENQMWLDGLYMGEPFYAEYARTFHDDTVFNDVARQLILMESKARDPKTGLLYHGWDASKKQRWANPRTGQSPNFWGRAMGWYGMALVDVLESFPADHPKRAELLAIINRFAAAVVKVQDKNSGLWYQVLDKATEKGNYPEASASCMFVYAMAKAVRGGYIPASYLPAIHKGYNGIIKQFIETDAKGQVNLKGTVSVSGLGGNPYRDGSYEYYLSEKVITNDAKGVGAFILASVEVERLAGLDKGKGKTVLLDSYFNNEHRKDITGATESYHYKWDEWDNNGFSLLGHVFNNYGATLTTLNVAPTASNLKKVAVYIIVDPDIPKENPDAKYIKATHITAIGNWVKQGGVLLVLNNDTGNAEFKHLNKLMAKFGMLYNETSINLVQNGKFEQGAVNIAAGNSVFKTAKKVYLKEISTLTISGKAKPILTHQGKVVVASAKYGKGSVLAVGDPWFYNEYLDGRKLPADFENYKAANDVVKWLIQQGN